MGSRRGGADHPAASGAGAATAPALIVAADPVARAAALLVEWLRALADEEPGPTEAAVPTVPRATRELRLAIPGGSALEVVLQCAPLAGRLWGRVALTWVDERCVPLADPASNRGVAMRRGLLPPARVVPLLEDGETPQTAIARFSLCYADELGGGLDLVVLGMGPDGHVASLFPDRMERKSGIVAYVPDSPKPPAHRLTLTRDTLACAHRTLLFAAGENKREALERLLHGDPTLPATGLPGLTVVTDLEIRA